MTDIEIASQAKLKNISEIAKAAGIKQDDLELYGNYKAKIKLSKVNPKGKLVLVTAINPTTAGEGKTTISIGLADGMKYIGKKVMLALREPSLGPVFGVKGGATGGGRSQVMPMDEINLHFTGDLHAITCANNLLSSVIDNHLHQGNLLNLNPKRIVWRRCIDLNDRALRSIMVGMGGAGDGVTRPDGFDITAASEIMAILCLANDMADLKERLGRIIIGYTRDNKPVQAKELNVQNAMAIILRDALKPNLVQTLEGTPALIHGGPFANIAHGCNSIVATKAAMTLADYTVTEAGFGADLGAEKFLDVKCLYGDISPNVVVVVATIRALKLHGGADKNNLAEENIEALKKGLPNLLKHIQNITQVYNLPCVVALNRFASDTTQEINELLAQVKSAGAVCAMSEAHGKGGEGAQELAKIVCELADKNAKIRHTYAYSKEQTLKQKITAVAQKIYGADGVDFSAEAIKSINSISKNGYGELPVIVAKTQYSLSDNPALLGRPSGFKISVREIQLRAGAGFVVAVAGDIMLMPGLPKVPASDRMEIDNEGNIVKFYC